MSFARNFSDKYSKSLMDKGIDVSKNFAKTAGKKILKKRAKATRDLIGNKIADKITAKPSKNHIMKKYSQMKLIMKYRKKDIFLLKKDKKLLMN